MNFYNEPCYISDPVGNNAFSYPHRHGGKLYVPPLIDGSLADVKMGDQVVFEDFDDADRLHSCVGLQAFVRTTYSLTNVPVYICDNHNHVFYFWHEALKKGVIQPGATLLHVDGHRDTRVPERNPTAEELADLPLLATYTNTVLNVGNYIPPAVATGLVGEVISITGAGDMRLNPPKKIPNLIANIDLDFWAAELDYINQGEKDHYVKGWLNQASLITISTSPFFIEPERALSALARLFPADGGST